MGMIFKIPAGIILIVSSFWGWYLCYLVVYGGVAVPLILFYIGAVVDGD